MQKFNRAAIRAARKHPRPIAAIMAARALRADGRANTLCHPTARKVLAGGVVELFRKSCQPVVLRITETKAAFLPGYHPTPQGAQWCAAFGLHVNGRGTWVSRWAYVCGLPPEKARDQIEVRLLADLACACNVPGVRVMEVRKGTCRTPSLPLDEIAWLQPRWADPVMSKRLLGGICRFICGEEVCEAHRITHAERRLREAIADPKQGWQSTGAEMSYPSGYALMMAWSGSVWKCPLAIICSAICWNKSGSAPR